MQQMIDDLKGIPGVIGASVILPNQGVEVNNLPTLFKPDRLVAIGKLLSKALSAGQHNFPGLSDLMFNYEEAAIICRPMPNGRVLSVFCDPGVNLNLLVMSMNLALQDYQQGGSTSRPKPHVSSTASPVSKIDAEIMLREGPLAKELNIMRSQLNKIMGPMSQIVFEEALLDWAASGATDRTNLGRLADLIGKEIDDREKTAQYRDLVRAALTDGGNHGG